MKRLICLATVLCLASVFGARPVLSHTEADPFVADLMAGRTLDAGDVLAWNDADHLYVKYAPADGWCLGGLHLHIAAALGDIPQTKNGNPVPGKFDYKADLGCASDTTFVIPLTWGTGAELYIAAKAEVSGSPGPSARASYYLPEGAWAAGMDFPGKNWATYFTYTV